MPSERFLNLPEEKKKRIISAALKEFARVSYDEISINRIIQDAGIPRGSFYQYFEDKADLQMYMLTGFRDYLKKETELYLKEEKGDLFDFFQDALAAIVKAGTSETYINVCKNVFSQLGGGECKGNEIFAKDGQLLFEQIIHHMKDKYYKEYSIEKLTLVWEILLQLLKEAIVRIFLLDEPQSVVIDKYQRKIKIIESGMNVKETENA